MKKFLFLFLFSILLTFIFLPKILSNSFVKTLIEKRLCQKYLAKVLIEDIEFSWLGPQKISQVVVVKKDLTAKVQKILLIVPFWQIQNFESHILVNDIQMSLASNRNLEFKKGFVSIQDQKISSEIATSAQGLLKIEGFFATPNEFDIKLDIQNFPSQILDLALPKISFSQILGDVFSCDGTIERKSKNWNLNLQISSPRLASDIQLKTDHNKIVLLKPFVLKTICQDYCEKHILSLGPQDLIKNISFNNPINIIVQDKDSVIDQNIKEIFQSQISEAEIDLGKLQITVGKKLSPFLQLFQKAKIGPEILLWLTPAVLSLHEGVLDLKRIDLLINNSFSIFFWGQANLIDHTLNMTLAIPSRTISKIYGIGNVPSNYNLLVKVSGTFENPVFDVNSALTKLAIISGIKQGVKQIPGLGGKILNNTIDIFNEKIENVPPPSRPIPW